MPDPVLVAFGALVLLGLYRQTGTAAWLYRVDFYVMVLLGRRRRN